MSRSPRASRTAAQRLSRSWLAPRAAAAGLGVSVLLLAGCAQMDAALSQQAAVVTFKSSTPVATVLKIRAACSHVPNVKPAKIKKNTSALDVISPAGRSLPADPIAAAYPMRRTVTGTHPR